MLIEKKLGKVLEVENPIVDNTIMRTFLRVRLRINITEPFITGFWVPKKVFPKTLVALYEKLYDFCYNCGCPGHEQKICTKEKKMHMFDDWIGVPLAKSMALIILEKKYKKT